MNQTEESLEFYNALVSSLIASKSTQTLEFEGLAHARIVTSGLISMATKGVDVFCKSLTNPLWVDPSVSAHVQCALKKGVSFNVITQEDTPRYAGSVFKRYGISILHSRENSSLNSLDTNFIASDGLAYAILKPTRQTGVACFNDEATASKFRQASQNMVDRIREGM